MQHLLRCLAVAGFAAMNVMLLSVSIWAGEASGIDAATRDLFHWISALITLPASAYAGRPFFLSAARALRARALNMDVPISLGLVVALAMSLGRDRARSRARLFRQRADADVLPAAWPRARRRDAAAHAQRRGQSGEPACDAARL